MKLPSRITGLVTLVLLFTFASSLAWYYYWARLPDIDEVGGTILVYQIDKAAKNAADSDAEHVAAILQRRFAFDRLRHVTVQAGDDDQIEIRIPRVGDHDADAPSIKNLVAQVGRLEFRILANNDDDELAIDAAKHMINARELGLQLDQELQDAQSNGLPPPCPRELDGAPRKYHLRLARGQTSTVSYSWVKLGQTERRDLNLDNAARDDPLRDFTWKEALAHRGQAVQLPDSSARGREQGMLLMEGALFYSRTCANRHLAEQDRRAKAVDYFVLARYPEFDPATGKHTTGIEGSCLADVGADRDFDGRPMVSFAFNPVGADLVATLTRKNVSESDAPGAPWKKRHLAIVLDGQVMAAPTINSEIRDRATITGAFTERQVEELVGILRAGTLPSALLPRPVREVAVPGRRGP